MESYGRCQVIHLVKSEKEHEVLGLSFFFIIYSLESII